MSLSDEEKEVLMNVAKESIRCAVMGKETPEFEISSENLKENCGAFVTITKKGDLRGCIGYILPVDSLYKIISDVAKSAALSDPRFPPVSEDELSEVEVDISVLSPLKEISDISEIEVGKHGLLIEKGGFKGLLLPQVATEYNWDRIKFLEQTCYKAGLNKDAWKESDTTIKIFSAEVFGEKSDRE